MFIEPNGKVYFLTGVPLDPTYEHTLYWENIEQQDSYFSKKAIYGRDNVSYQRANLGRIKVDIKADSLYSCNYLRFQNTAFGSKWFYCFVRQVNYISNVVSEVVYDIDVMQTWYFDYKLGQTYVERQHTETDNAGEWLLNEGFEAGQYINVEASQKKAPTKYVLTATNDSNGGAPGATKHSGLWTNLYVREDNVADGIMETANEFNNNGYGDAIVSAYAALGSPGNDMDTTFTAPSRGNDMYLYTPKNKKLLVFPYTKLVVTSPDGTKTDYMYEGFSNPESPTFAFKSMSFPSSSCVVYPKNYFNIADAWENGSADATAVNLGCTGDAFKAYMAQTFSYGGVNKASSAVSNGLESIGVGSGIANAVGKVAGVGLGIIGKAGSAISGVVSGALSGGVAGAGIVAASEISNAIGSGLKGASQPNSLLSAPSANNMTFALDTFGAFRVAKQTIMPEYAKAIDGYFTKYGYAVRTVKIPNIHARPHWTYVQTKGCVLHGNRCPADAEEAIAAIYNNGITFWTNPSEVGNYNLDNSPV